MYLQITKNLFYCKDFLRYETDAFMVLGNTTNDPFNVNGYIVNKNVKLTGFKI